MAKSTVTMKYTLSVNGNLEIRDDHIMIDNPDTGETFDLIDLLADFDGKPVSMSAKYDEDFSSAEN